MAEAREPHHVLEHHEAPRRRRSHRTIAEVIKKTFGDFKTFQENSTPPA